MKDIWTKVVAGITALLAGLLLTGAIRLEKTRNVNGVFNSLLALNCSSSCDFSASNNKTGSGSSNNTSVNINNDVDITVNNDANVENDVDADLNTGGNSADENTGDGKIRNGD